MAAAGSAASPYPLPPPEPVPGAAQAPQASSSLNIAIQGHKDFPGAVAGDVCTQLQDLYSEFTMADGRALFECSGLVKATGIDLMNCPLDVVLKLRVRKRLAQSQGSTVLWHVVLPLKQISKYLLNPPHEWETWIGLFPSSQSLEAHGPDTMFTQAVHLISRPEYPKLRLRFTYHNPELQAQISARCEMEQQESRRRMEHTQKVGRQQFEEIHKLTRGLRGAGGEGASEREGPSSLAAVASAQSVEVPAGVASGSGQGNSPQSSSTETLREALTSALAFIGSVHQMLLLHPRRGRGAPELPPLLAFEEVMRAPAPGTLLDAQCMQLHQCLCAVAFADAPASPAAAAAAATSPSAAAAAEAEVERSLAEGLRVALLGLSADEAAMRGGGEGLARLRARSPGLWEALREVSTLVRERAQLLQLTSEQQQSSSSQQSQSGQLQLQLQLSGQQQVLFPGTGGPAAAPGPGSGREVPVSAARARGSAGLPSSEWPGSGS